MGVCSCNRSLGECMMNDFWKELKFRKITPKEFLERYKNSKQERKEQIEELFTIAESSQEINDSALKIYNKFASYEESRKYFFPSLMILLNDHMHEFKICFTELDNLNGTNLLTDNKISKAEWLNFLRFHFRLVSLDGIPDHIKQDKETNFNEVYKSEHIEAIIKRRALHDLTIEQFIKDETIFLQNDSEIRELIFEQYKIQKNK